MNKYEALGRYTEAQEQLAKLNCQREIAINQMETYWHELKYSSGTRNIENQTSINSAILKIETLLEQYKKANEEVLALTEQINQYAEFCDKPKIDIK